MRPVLGLCLLALCSTASAQTEKVDPGSRVPAVGTITDGINQFDYTSPDGISGFLTDYEVPIDSDQQFSNWWWYRVAGDTAETIMPPPDTETYLGDTATLTWADVSSRGLFAATLVVRIRPFGDPGASLTMTLTVDNLTAQELALTVFHYMDMDVDGSAGNDSAIEVDNRTMEITEISSSIYHAEGADSYRVDVWPLVRDALNDEVVDDFADTGLPFLPADFTGSFQWDESVPASGSEVFLVRNCVGPTTPECADVDVFMDGFESGDTSAWGVTVP